MNQTTLWTITIAYVSPLPGSPLMQPGVLRWVGDLTAEGLGKLLDGLADEVPFELFRAQLRQCALLARLLRDEWLSGELLNFTGSWDPTGKWYRADGVAIGTTRYLKQPLVLSLVREEAYSA